MVQQRTNEQSTSLMTLGEHIEELRKRLIYIILGVVVAVVCALFLTPQIIFFVKAPFSSIMTEVGLDPRLQTLAPSDGFIMYMKISVLGGIVLSAPWIFHHLWQFFAMGLYPKERRFVFFAVPSSALLFVGGVIFFITVVAPITLRFFIVFNKKMLGVDSTFTFENYVSFLIHMSLVFGFAFQLPTAIFSMNRVGLVSLSTLSRLRKYVLLIIFIVAALATPPDVISQLALALPLYLLFELGLLLCYFLNREKSP